MWGCACPRLLRDGVELFPLGTSPPLSSFPGAPRTPRSRLPCLLCVLQLLASPCMAWWWTCAWARASWRTKPLPLLLRLCACPCTPNASPHMHFPRRNCDKVAPLLLLLPLLRAGSRPCRLHLTWQLIFAALLLMPIAQSLQLGKKKLCTSIKNSLFSQHILLST